MKINEMRKELSYAIDMYELVYDCYIGEKALKEKPRKYIHKPKDMTDEMYADKVKVAFYQPVVDKKLDSDIGIITKNETQLSVSDEAIKQWIEDNGVDTNKTKLPEFKRRIAEEITMFGRVGILIDYAVFDNVRHLTQKNSSKNRPYATIYTSSNIINWRQDVNGLNMVVLKEMVEETDPNNPFSNIEIEQYRGLFIDNNNRYVQILSRKGANGEWYVYQESVPTINGKPLDFIPFKISNYDGSDINIVPKPPVYDLAVASIHYFRDSANSGMLSNFLGSPTVFYKEGDRGLDTPEDYSQVEAPAYLDPESNEVVVDGKREATVCFGYSVINYLPNGDSVEMLSMSADGTEFLRQEKDDKLKAMDTLGAKHLGVSNNNESFDTAYMKRSADFATLSTMARVCSEAIEWTIEMISYWNFKKEVEVSYKIETDYSRRQVPAENLRDMIKLYELGAIPLQVILDLLKDMGLLTIKMSAEDALEIIREQALL